MKRDFEIDQSAGFIIIKKIVYVCVVCDIS